MSLRYKHLPKNHIANVKIGDKINTPMGIETVYACNQFRFTTYKSDSNGKTINTGSGHYGNVAYFEGGAEKVFSIILD